MKTKEQEHMFYLKYRKTTETIKPPCPLCSRVVPKHKHKYCSSLCGYRAKAEKERERIKRIGRKSYYVKKGYGSKRNKAFSNEYVVCVDGKVKNIPIVDCECGGRYLIASVRRGCCNKLNSKAFVLQI